MMSAMLLITGLALGLGAVLVWLDTQLGRAGPDPATAIVELLPRIQCGQCGYPGCRPYADAILAGRADINCCPPGGHATVLRLAELLGREPKPLDTSGGSASWAQVAIIDEDLCIGCNLCARACPVDAIVGAMNWMHTVLADHCTGCELCLAPCPVDCISMAGRPRPLAAAHA